MKKIAIMTAALLAVTSLAACSGANEPATATAQTAQTETIQTETTSQTASETVPESENFTTIETETVPQNYIQDADSESWFERIRSEWAPGGKELSDSDKVGSALYELSDGEICDDMIFDASMPDCSSVRAQGDVDASLTGCSIYKMAGDSQGKDKPSFYGKNAAVQALDGAFLRILNAQVNAAAGSATGVFAYNDAVICIADSTVDVSGGGAGGIQVAGGGKLYAWNLTVNTESKAAIRSDRGGGVMEVNGGTYTANGKDGCPAVYSTADITVRNAYLTSNHSRAVIIEGRNSVTLEGCISSGCDESTKEGSIKANVLIYQSHSGDAKEGTGTFTMTGGSMKANAGYMFYCTNTSAVINLEATELVYSPEGGFLRVSSGRWGNDGSNGAGCVLNCKDQKMEGEIYVDEISSLEINMTGSDYTGAVNPDGEEGYVKVSMDENSSWILTADSYITEFDGSLENVDTGNFHLYVNGESIK